MAEQRESAQPEDAEPMRPPGSEEEQSSGSAFFTKLYGGLLVVPGVVLYVYILYIVLANMLLPGSLAPFLRRDKTETEEDASNKTLTDEALTNAILIDAALLCLFVAQHSLMASPLLKNTLTHFGLSAVCRLLYIFATCCTIQFMYHFWRSTPSHTLWDCHGNCLLSYALKTVHIISWLSIACSIFTIDYLELLGIKQLYYSYSGFENPIHYKSAEQQYLLSHMRHPIFTTPLLILWAVPSMSYDRLLIAIMLPLYMAWGSQINILDASYVKQQFMYKWKQLLVGAKQE